jgi:hypothetical protein
VIRITVNRPFSPLRNVSRPSALKIAASGWNTSTFRMLA